MTILVMTLVCASLLMKILCNNDISLCQPVNDNIGNDISLCQPVNDDLTGFY